MFNLGQNICNLFNFLVQFLFTTSETELDYYHQKINVRVALQVAEQLKTFRNFKKNPEMFGDIMVRTQSATQKTNFDVSWKTLKKSAVNNHLIEKPVSFIFVNL